MSIMTFIKGLLPTIDRSALQDDSRITQTELEEKVVPSYSSAAAAFDTVKPKSSEVGDLATIWNRKFKKTNKPRGSTFIGDIYANLPYLAENLTYLRGLLTSEFHSTIATGSMTVKQAFIMRSVSNISFLSRYSLSLLSYIYVMETDKIAGGRVDGLEISRAEKKYVEDKFEAFTRIFSLCAMQPSEFKQLVSKTPELILNAEQQAELQQTYGPDLDPAEKAGYFLSGFSFDNPIYSIRMIPATWQTKRHKLAEERRAQLSYRLMYLEMQRKGEENPQLENEIKILENRIRVLDQDIRETEADLDL